MFKILTMNNISETGLTLLDREKFDVSDKIENPDGVIVRSASLHDMELSDNLKAIARAGAGVNNIPVEKCSEKGIVVFNAPGANANAVKELVIAGLLLSSRKIVDGINWVKSLEGEKDITKKIEANKNNFTGPEIMGKKVGVIGLGAIGILVANACKSLKMTVYGYDPFMSVDTAWNISRDVIHTTDVKELYAECDYISLHLPLNGDTEHMIDKEAFELMKDGVKILNFARGPLVNDADMKEALESGKVSAYVTDFPSDELLGTENLVPIPHLGASTPESEENCAIMASKEMRNYLLYGNIANSVNFPDCELPVSGKRRVCVAHSNKPKALSRITNTLSEQGINIDNMINKSRGKYAYTIMAVDEDNFGDVEKVLFNLEEVIKVRII